MTGISRDRLLERLRDVEEALRGQPTELETQSSPDAARSAGKKGLAYLPYLTLADIVHLRSAGIRDLETLQEKVMEVPDPVWPRIVDLLEARVLEVPQASLAGAAAGAGNGSGQQRCLALTRSGGRCRNPPRGGSDYCASHKGYQPTEIERRARQRGLLPNR